MRFPAREFGRLARGESFDAKEFEHFGHGAVAVGGGEMRDAVFDVLFRGEMGKEGGRLEKIAKLALLGRQVDFPLR